MRVVRRSRQVLLAHRLPERMDRATRDFASKAYLAISELPGQPGSYSIFNLRWNINSPHVYGVWDSVVVLDTDLKVLTESDFTEQYEDAHDQDSAV